MDDFSESVLRWMKENPSAIQKAKPGLDDKTILFREPLGSTLEFVPSNENGKPHVGQKVFGIVANPAAFQEAINKAQSHLACREDYDEFMTSSTQFQFNFAQPKSIMCVRYVFEGPEEVRASLKSEEFSAIVNHVRELAALLTKATNPEA